MKYENVGLIHAIAICIVAFNVMACSNGDNKVLQADGKESIQSSIAKVSHIAEGIEKTMSNLYKVNVWIIIEMIIRIKY